VLCRQRESTAIERKKRFEVNPAKHRQEVFTTASAICPLEDADYEGHSLAMLRRIAAALNQRVEIRFLPIRRSA